MSKVSVTEELVPNSGKPGHDVPVTPACQSVHYAGEERLLAILPVNAV